MTINSNSNSLPERLIPGLRNDGTGSRNRRDEQKSQSSAERSGLPDLLERLPGAAQGALQRAVQSSTEVTWLLDRIDRPDTQDALDAALDLTPGRAGRLLATLSRMSPEEADAALKSLAELLKRGVVGYEYREVNGEPMKVFIDVAMGSDLHRAPLVRGAKLDRLI